MTPVPAPVVHLEKRRGVATWRSLGTYVHLATADPGAIGAAADLAVAVLAEVDATCSRFREDSDLSRVNRASGRHTVSPVLVGAVRLALEAAEDTEGLVDPTMGEILIAAGYDRTFDDIRVALGNPAEPPAPRAGWRSVRIIDDQTLEVPARLGLDLGATGKAYAADLVADLVAEQTGSATLVSVGGDVATIGCAAPWAVAVSSTKRRLDEGDVTVRLALPGGLGLATSSVLARRWVRGGSTWHHVIDPRTGRPATGPWASVTALGHTATSANVATTAALVRGAGALDWLEQRGVAGLLVAADGVATRTRAWRELDLEDNRAESA